MSELQINEQIHSSTCQLHCHLHKAHTLAYCGLRRPVLPAITSCNSRTSLIQAAWDLRVPVTYLSQCLPQQMTQVAVFLPAMLRVRVSYRIFGLWEETCFW